MYRDLDRTDKIGSQVQRKNSGECQNGILMAVSGIFAWIQWEGWTAPSTEEISQLLFKEEPKKNRTVWPKIG